MNQSELEANICSGRQARENAYEQVAIGLSFTSDWSRKWREIFKPITEVVQWATLGNWIKKTHPPNFLNQWETRAIPFYHVIPVKGMNQWGLRSKVIQDGGWWWECDLVGETADHPLKKDRGLRWRLMVGVCFLGKNRGPSAKEGSRAQLDHRKKTTEMIWQGGF